MSETQRTIGVALSGGGHRATVWGIGVLLYLADAGLQRRVTAISSVSGGSIANGVVAHRLDYAQSDGEAVREAVRPLLHHVSREGLFVWGRATNRYVVAALGSLGVGLLGVLYWLLRSLLVGVGGLHGWEYLVGLAGLALLVLGLTALGRRSVVLDAALGRVHFSAGSGSGGAGGAGRPARLADVHRSLDHVFCATDLQAGRHFYFTPDFLYSYSTGVCSPGSLPLSTAVQCSACLPGAFSARTLTLDDGGRVVLVDGGVYDNMADQWLVGLADRVGRLAGTTTPLPVRTPDLDDVVIANSAGPYRSRTLKGIGAPAIGDVRTLKLVADVMYSVTTTHRRQQLVRRDIAAARLAEREGEDVQRSALVHITQSPYEVAKDFSRGRDERARRAAAVLDLLGSGSEQRWRDLADRSTNVPTTLGRLGEEVTAELLEHSYVLAMCNLHILFGYPLLRLPDAPAFVDLTRSPGGSSPEAGPARAPRSRRPAHR